MLALFNHTKLNIFYDYVKVMRRWWSGTRVLVDINEQSKNEKERMVKISDVWFHSLKRHDFVWSDSVCLMADEKLLDRVDLDGLWPQASGGSKGSCQGRCDWTPKLGRHNSNPNYWRAWQGIIILTYSSQVGSVMAVNSFNVALTSPQRTFAI